MRLYQGRAFTEAPLDGMRRTIAARLTEAKQTIPHFYLRRDIELDALIALRAQLNARLAPRGVRLSVNDFVIKACALSLKAAPGCNAVWAGDRVLMFEAADVAVAVAVEGGLFTPVIRDAEAKPLSAISAEMKDLADRARARRLAPQEYQGGAFAISNLGMMGVESFDAVINPPHASILAVGAGVRRPVARGDALAAATVMSVTLSVDHRVIDGALGAEFLTALKGFLEEPLTMLV
jgi:pyruvate dehydrogenase E2 component (dihydrolipoamide acetyltransferase)